MIQWRAHNYLFNNFFRFLLVSASEFSISNFSFAGEFVVFELYSEKDYDTHSIRLCDIPAELCNPITKSPLVLVGIVDFKASFIGTRRSAGMGHYTAITLRAGSWVEYDDLKKEGKKLSHTVAVNPHLFVYCI